MATNSKLFANVASGPLIFSNIGVLETDTGSGVLPFISPSYPNLTDTAYTYSDVATYTGMHWTKFTAGATGNAAGTPVSEVLSFDYDVTAGAGSSIFGLDALVTTDAFKSVPGAAVGAVETVTDGSGNVVGSFTWTPGHKANAIWLPTGYSSLHINLVVTASVYNGGASTAGVTAKFSGISQGFVAGSVTLDKQVSVDGVNWFDAGSGVLQDPTTLVGDHVYYRVVVANHSTNGMAYTGASVVDAGGPGFTFGGAGAFNLAAGATITSDVSTAAAAAGHNFDTATVAGTVSLTGHTQTVSASDVADYTGTVSLAAAIVIDKQVSVDGSNWVDVGNGVLNDPTALAGGKVFYRAIVINTGISDETNVVVGDNDGTAYTFAGLGNTALAAGATATTDVATVTAVAGHVLDGASVVATAGTGGSAITVGAADTADYSGLTAVIAIDKQVSVDGTNWVDVGNGVLNDPTALVGGAVYYRAIVTNTGAVAETKVKVKDANGTSYSFGTAAMTSLAAGASATTSMITLTAASGHVLDGASVTADAAIGASTATLTASDTADYTGVAASIFIDKQVSVDGTNWVDVGDGVLNDPTALAGGTIYYRSIVTNTSALAEKNVRVRDAGGKNFLFGGGISTTLAAGASITTDVLTYIAAGHHVLDGATVTGTASAGSTTVTVTASDTADYSGVTAALSIDKQVSVDGTTWVDVGNGTLNDPTALVGGSVYYRAIVTNTGAINETNLSVADDDGTAYTFAGVTAIGLTVGASATTDVVTVTAQSGHVLDGATATATAGIGSSTTTLHPSDVADYNGVTAAVAIDKQVSVDGTNWVDVGSLHYDDPVLVAGGNVYYRAVVTNTGALTDTNVQVTDADGITYTFVGASSTTLGVGASATTDAITVVSVAGHNFDGATVTATASVGASTATVSAADTADYDGTTAAIVIDKQVSVDGTNWVDVGNGVLNNPDALVGGTVYYRAVVSNTGSLTETGVVVTDQDGTAYSFAGAGSTTLGSGAAATTDIITVTAASGHQLDGASVVGTITAGAATGTVGAADTADYTGVTAGIAIDKQVSVDGTNWVDVGSGEYDNPTALAGGTVYYRAVVTDTGALDDAGVTVTDADGTAYTFAGAGTTDLAAGASATSDVITVTAATGHQFDGATVSATASTGTSSATVSAGDTADYTGVTAGIAIDKQVSVDGTNWVDIGSGELDNPAALTGGAVYYRAIVSNDGALDDAGVTVTDADGTAYTFAGAGTTDLAAGASATTDAITVAAASGHQLDGATVAATASVGSSTTTVSAADTADYHGVTAAISVDKQVSVDGTNWVDVGAGELDNPTALVGGTVYYRAVVTDTGAVAESGVSVTDADGTTYTFGGAGTTALAVGASATTDVITVTAASGHQLDGASAAGTASIGTSTATVGASDTADYTGVTAAIAIDKQVSVDGTNWVDVGSGVFNNPTALAGGVVYYRAVVTDTGSLADTGVSVVDADGTAFTFAGVGTTSLAAGGAATTDAITVAAVAGHQFDGASVIGTASAGASSTTVSASDTADYTGATAAIAIDKQVSVDGTNWVDIGSGVLNDPTALAGGKVFYRAIVTNTGSLAETHVVVNDANGSAYAFGGAGSTALAAGGSATTDAITVTAVAGHVLDGASVTGTASAGASSTTLTAADTADYSGQTAAIAIDKQVSVDGTHWVDVGAGELDNPSALVGGKVFYRSIVTNTGSLAETNVVVTDANGAAYKFAGAASTALAVGASATTDAITVTAVAGHILDGASVTGTASVGASSTTLTASDTADYSGQTAAIAIDKQVSVDGTNWVDVGSGILNDPTALVGGKVFFRAILSNTGGLADTVSAIGDSTGVIFTFGGAAGTTVGVGATATSDIYTAVAVAGRNYDTATVTGVASAGTSSTTLTAKDTADYTGQSAAISIDKQVSVDGTHWTDVGSGVLSDPTALVGSNVFFRAILTNTGGLTDTVSAISDSTGVSFTFGGAAGTTVGVGAAVTSDVFTTVAATGHNYDTATVTAVASAGSSTATLTASDTADYTGATAAIAIDKQVSVDGTNWVDVGNGVLNDPTALIGGKVFYRAIVTNTGSLAETHVVVNDANGTGYKFSGATNISLAVGTSATTDVITLTAVAGHVLDGASVTGTASAGAATATLTASDTADYSGQATGIAIDKQISVDGSTWYDVTSGTLVDPTALVGGKVFYRAIVTNTGGVAETVTGLSDVGGPTPFKFGGASGTVVAAGATATSDVATTTAVAGHNIDTATVTATASAGATTATLTASDTADYTGQTAGIAIDKQISVDGSTWYDVTSGTLVDPTALVGGKVYYRAVVANTGGIAETVTGLTDVGGPTPFKFGGASGTVLAVGATATSDVATTTAVAGHNIDTATVTATASAGATTATVTASDTADYTGQTAGIAIDKQVSVDGTNWVDVGTGVLNDPTALVGGKVYYRAILTNTGSFADTVGAVSDVGGPAFTFGGHGGTTLAASATVTSDTMTATAAAGHNYDTATVTATASAGGTTATLTASDTADYTGGTAAISVDKQVSTDGTTWTDVGTGTLNDPTATSGGKVYFRVVVTNGGSFSDTGVTVTDTVSGAPGISSSDLTTAQSILANFNLVDFGNYAPTNETEGPVIVGGNLTGSSNFNVDFNGSGAGSAVINGQTYGALTVFGNVTGSVNVENAPANVHIQGNNTGSIDLNHNGNLYIEGTNSGTINSAGTIYTTQSSFGGTQVNGGSVLTKQSTATVFPFGSSITSLQTALVDLATGLQTVASAYPSGVQTLTVGNNVTYTPTAEVTLGGDKYSFITTTLANLASETNFGGVLNGSGDSATIVIVTGTSAGPLPNMNLTHAPNIIWDFVNATSLSFAGQWEGAILAPNATITSQGGDLSGSVIVAGINQTNELHFYSGGGQGFAGDLSGLAGTSSTTKSFTFGGSTTTTVGVGSTVTSDVLTLTATDGHQLDTATATGTATVSGVTTTVTASDTADYTGIGTCAPSPCTSLFPTFGQAEKLEFQFAPGTSVSTQGQGSGSGIATATLKLPSSPAFVVLTNNAGDHTAGALDYFSGTVASNGKLIADATLPANGGFFSTASGAYLYGHVFASQSAYTSGAAAVQEIRYDSSGNSVMALDDTIGSLKLIGYVGTQGGYLA